MGETNRSTYQVELRCDNCGFSGEMQIYKGVLVHDCDCANCGCKTLRRNIQLSGLAQVGTAIGQSLRRNNI